MGYRQNYQSYSFREMQEVLLNMGNNIQRPDVKDMYLLDNVFDMSAQKSSKLKVAELVDDVDTNRFKTSY